MNINIDWTRLGIATAVQAIFLTFALGAMLKQQKLKWKVPGLLGSVLLACLFVQIPYAGIVISFVVALLCITKVIGARTFTDALFAVGAAFALFAVFNFVAVPPLTGVLLPLVKVRARVAEPAPAAAVPASASTNRPAATNAAAATVPVPASPAESPAKAATVAPPLTNASPAVIPAEATGTPTTPAPMPAHPAEPVFDTNRLNAVRLAGDIMKHFYVKGVSQGATISIAMISNGTRNFDIVVGDVIQLQTSDGRYAAVKCESVGDDQVIVSVEGVKVSLFRR
jgi:hypothetical protein